MLIISKIKLGVFMLLMTLVCSCSEQVKPTIIDEFKSPLGTHVAYYFEYNSGATSPFVYRLSILNGDDKLNNYMGNAYRSYNKFSVVWIDDNTLMIVNDQDDRIIKQEKHVNGVNIIYSFSN